MERKARRTLIIVTADQPHLKELASMLQGQPGFELKTCTSLVEAMPLVQGPKQFLVLTVATKVDDLHELTIFTTVVRKQLERGNLNLLVLNSFHEDDAQAFLKMIGCTVENAERATTAAALKPMVENHFRIMGQFYFRSDELLQEFEIVAPLEVPENCWLLRSKEDVRRVGNFWVIELAGPGPGVGQWSLREDKGKDGSDSEDQYWEWKPRDLKQADFLGKDFTWVFRGKRPGFVHHHWTFIGKDPELTLFRSGAAVCDYLKSYNSVLQVSGNSETAKKHWPRIHETIMNVYLHHREAERFGTDREIVYTAGPANAAQERERRWGEWKSFLEDNSKSWPQATPHPSKAEVEGSNRRNEFVRVVREALNPKQEKFTVTEGNQRQAYLEELAQGEYPIVLLFKDQGLSRQGVSQGFDKKSERLFVRMGQLQHSAPGGKVPGHEGSDVDKVLVNVGLRLASVFFAIEKKQLQASDGGYALPVPESFFRVQRRGAFRLTVPEGRQIGVRINPGWRPYGIFSLSATGLGFQVLKPTKIELETFSKGAKLNELVFSFQGESFRTAGEVRWAKHNRHLGVLKAGVQFLDMTPARRQLLNLMIFEEAFKFIETIAGFE